MIQELIHKRISETQQNIVKSFTDSLEKGRAFPIGTVREWNGEKWKKMVQGWVRLSDGKGAPAMAENEVDIHKMNQIAARKNMPEYLRKAFGVSTGSTMYKHVRDSFKNNEEFTEAVKDVLGRKLRSPEKVKELFKLGVLPHEIVNITGTPPSATLDYIKKAWRQNEFYDATVKPRPSSATSVDVTAELSNDPAVGVKPDKPIQKDKLKIPKLSVKERFDSYKLLASGIGLKISKALFVYGSGGVGKTYTLLNEKDGVFARLKLRKADLSPEIPIENQDGSVGHNENSIVGINEQTGAKFLKKDKYDYIVSTGSISAVEMFKFMQEHNGKIIVFDDSDEVLKNPDAVNVLKGALDSGGDGSISWRKKGTIQSEFSNVPGAKPVTDSKGKVLYYELPKTFKFNGSIVFISNFTADNVPQAFLSRADRIDLTMTRHEVIDAIKQIKDKVKIYDTDRNLYQVSKETRQEAFDFMNKYIDMFDKKDLNIRTFGNIAKNLQLAKDSGLGDVAEKTIIASYLLKTNYKGK